MSAKGGIIALTFLFSFLSVYSEGTKEIYPNSNNVTRMVLRRDWDYTNFARYNAAETQRLNFTICNNGEIAYFGFNGAENSNVKMRVRRASDGAVVFAERNLPTSGEGYIQDYNRAVAGPREIVGAATGYDAFQINGLAPDDYYIEFNTNDNDFEFRYFDITVATAANSPIPGRVWSQEWLLTTRSFNNPFLGELYIYSDDGIVTSVDFNGIRPYVFNISANPTGVKTTGDFNEDRQSVGGRQTYPQYKIFLNPPDENCYPSGEFGQITGDITVSGCGLDKCINIPVDQPGRVLILLNLNGQAGYQANSADIQFDTTISPDNFCIPWDTRDNFGNLIPEGQNVNLQIDYLNGITHLPMFDVESHPNGYSVGLVRPLAPQVPVKPFLFWDDVNIVSQGGVQGTSNFSGCNSPSCHNWFFTNGFNNNLPDYGNLNTINTWWYANIINKNTDYVVTNATVDADVRILGRGEDGGNDTTTCRNSGAFQLAGNVSEAPSATWTTNGSGTFSNVNDLSATYTPSDEDYNNGSVRLTLTSDPFGECPTDSDFMILNLDPGPSLSIGPGADLCESNSNVNLQSSFSNADGIRWLGGNGTFIPNRRRPNVTYNPTPEEIASGEITLILSTNNVTNVCPNITDSVTFNFQEAPVVTPGTTPDTICASTAFIQLSGTIENAGGGSWLGGNGNFVPSRDSLNAQYFPTNNEKNSGSLTLTLSSRLETGGCQPVTEDITLTFKSPSSVTVNSPTIQTCASTDTIPLSATVTGAATITWSGGNGSYIPSNTIANPSYLVHPDDTTAGSIMIFVETDGNDGCSIVKDSILVQFSSPPVAKVDADNQLVCANNARIELAGAFSNSSGVRWVGQGGTFSPSEDSLVTTYIPSQAEIDANFTFLTLTTTGNGFCEPASDVQNVIISPAPTADAQGPYTVCKNNPTIQVSGTSQNSTGMYWSSSEGSFSDSASFNTIFTATQNQVDLGLPITLTFTATQDPVCAPVSDNATVTFTPSPTVDAGPTQTICANNSTVQLNGSFTRASQVTWSGGNGSYSNMNATGSTYQPTQAEIDAGEIKLFLSTSGGIGNCINVTDSVMIAITPAPTVEAGPNQTVCENNARVTLNGTVTNASGGIWSGGDRNVGSTVTTLTNAKYSPSNQEKNNGVVKLYLESTGNGNCNPVQDSIEITITPQPEITNFSNVLVCADAPSVTFNPNLSVATGVIWSGGQGTYSPNNTTLNTTYSPSITEVNNGFVNLKLTTTGNGLCKAEDFSRKITISKAPIVSAGSNQTICGDENSVQLNGTVSNAGGGRWTTLGSGSFSSQTNLNATYQPSNLDKQNGLVKLVLTTTGNGLCNALSDTMQIAFSEIPVANAGNNRTLCANEFPITLNASGSIGSWVGGNGSFSPNRNTLNATYTPTVAEVNTGSVILTYESNVSGVCPQVSDDVKFNLKEGPIVDAGPDITICGNLEPFTLTATIQNAGNGFWNTSGTGQFSPSAANATLTYLPSPSDTSLTDTTKIIFYVGTVGNGGCPSSEDSLMVSFVPAPILNAGADQTLCADGNGITLNGSLVNITTVSWSGGNGGVFTPNNTINTTYSPTPSDLNQTNLTFVVTSPATAICPAESDTTVISLVQGPTNDAGPNTIICADSSFIRLQASITGANTGLWTTSGTGTFSPTATDTVTRYYPSLVDTAAGQVILYFNTNGSGICEDVQDSLILTLSNAPIVFAGNDTTICSDSDPIPLNGQSNGVSSGFIWTTSGTGTFSDNTSLLSSYTLSQDDIDNAIVTLTLQTTGSGDCNEVSHSFNILMTPQPEISASLNQTKCIIDPSVTVSASITEATGVHWSSLTNGTFTDSLALTTDYFFSSQDTINGFATLIATSTGNGQCKTYTDTTQIQFQNLPIVSAGSDVEICGDAASVPISGTVSGAASGTWSSSGSGIFTPNFATLTTNYQVTSEDTTNGSVALILTSTGSGVCPDVSDSLIVTITDVPTVNAGNDTTVCANVDSVQLNGQISIATGANWLSSGTGTFSPNDTTLTAVYIPSSSDTAAGNVTITLVSTGNGNCNRVLDDFVLNFTKAPRADAGPSTTICSDSTGVALNSTITSFSSLVWRTSGTGVFGPDSTFARPTYYPSEEDTTAGSVTLSVFVNGQGTCNSISASTVLNLAPEHQIQVSDDFTVCEGTRLIPIAATSQNATGGSWSTTSAGRFTPSAFDAASNFAPSNSNTDNTIILTYTTDDGGICPPKSESIEVIVTPKPTVNAGNDLILCADAEFFRMRGAVTNATGGTWSTSGNGTFLPNANALIVDYALSDEDVLEDSLVFSLSATDTNNCATITDELIVNLTPIPTISAGSDINVCPGVAFIPLSGNVTVAGGGVWETLDGMGTFVDSSDLSTQYIPDPSESVEGNSITISLNSTDNGNCQTYFEDIIISFTNTSFINATPEDTTICTTDFPIQLGSEGAQGEWSTLGSGTFLPNNRAANAVYQPSSTDSINGSVKLYLTSINNGTCPAIRDSLSLSFIPGPVVNAGPDLTICTNENTVTLQGSSFNTNSIVWSSNGKGTFDNLSSATPTYTLSPQDKSLGAINFSLISLDNGQCSQPIDRMKVSVLPGPTVDPGNGFTLCANSSEIQLSGSFTNATGATWTGGANSFLPSNTSMTARYQIQPADTANGSVTLTLTSQGHPNCNPSTANVTFNFKKFPIAEAGIDQTICANTNSITLKGTAKNAANRRWSVLNGTGQFSPSNQLDSTTYFISAADTSRTSLKFYYTATPSNLCPPVKDSLTLSITPSPIISAGLNIDECETVPTITLNGSAKNTSSILWISSGAGSFNPDNTTLNSQYLPDSIDLVKGAINLELRSTEANCNPVSDFATINFVRFPEAIVNAGVDISVCSDAPSIQLQGTIRSAAKGKWSTSGSGTFMPNDSTLNAKYIPVPSDTLAGSIQIRLTAQGNDECGEVTDSITLTFTSAPTANLGGNITVCKDTNSIPLRARLTVSSGVQWSTSGSGIFSASRFDTVTTYIPSKQDKDAGVIVVSALTTGNGTCQAITESITIRMTPIPSIDAGVSQLVCETMEDVFVKGSIKVATQGVWSTSGTGTFNNPISKQTTYQPSINDTENGMVILKFTTTDNGQCKPVDDRAIITFEDAPLALAGEDQTICEDFKSINLNSIVENESSIIWSTLGSGSFSITDGESTTYSLSNSDKSLTTLPIILTATGNANCGPTADTVNVFIIPSPEVEALAGNLCQIMDGVSISGTIINASGGLWSTNGTGSFSPNSATINGHYYPSFGDAKNGMVDLLLTSTGNGLCQPVSSETFVDIWPLPIANAGKDQTVCVGADVTLSATIEPNISYEWRIKGGGIIANSPTTKHTVTTNTIFELTAIRQDGCSSTDEITVNVFELPTIGLDTHYCYNDTLLITADISNMPLVPGSFQWFRDGVILQGERSTSYVVPSPGNYSLAFSYAGCSVDSTTYVTPLPQLVSFDEIGCRLDSTVIRTTNIAGASYSWTNLGSTVATENPATVATPLDSSVFSVAVTDLLGCVSRDSLKVFGVEKPIVNLLDSSGCDEDLIPLDAEPLNIDSLVDYQLVYSWFMNNQAIADTNSAIIASQTGIYKASVSIGQCVTVDSSIIQINASPVVDLPELIEICIIKNQLQEVDAGVSSSYLWSTGDTTQKITVEQTGLYYVTVTNEFNCITTDSVFVEEVCPPEIFVPKAFVPGTSNPDQFFDIFGHDFINFKMTIYNRWGEVIYYTEDPKQPWDGYYGGELMPVGVYPWVIDFQDLNGVQQPTLEGSVTIVR